MEENMEDSDDVIFIGIEKSSRTPLPTIDKANGETPLHFAARSNDAKEVARLLKAGDDANASDNSGNTPLHLAVESKAAEAVQVLLHHPATNVNARTKDGETPLLLAAFHGKDHVPIAVDLIHAGAVIDAANISREVTAMHWAALYNCRELVDLLLKKGAYVDPKDRYHFSTPLHYATKAEVITRLLADGADTNAQDRDGRTPLHLAVTRGDHSVFMLLLHQTEDLNIRAKDGSTPLTTAVSFEMDDAAMDLIKHGADIHAAGREGMTVLHCAADFYHVTDREKAARRTNLVCHLLDLGMDPNAPNNFGNTPLHIALKTGSRPVSQVLLQHPLTDLHARNMFNGVTPLMMVLQSPAKTEIDIFEYLINAGESIHAEDHECRTVLHYAAIFNKVDEFILLIELGANINAVDGAGMAVLHTAAQSEAWGVFGVLLLKQTLDCNVRTPGGRTPLMMMMRQPKPFAMFNFERLIELGADIHASDNEGHTVLHYAAKFGKVDEVLRLIELGADVKAANEAGMTVLDAAVKSKEWATFDVLTRERSIHEAVRQG